VHFNRSLRPQTDVSLGDCSYLNTCHRIESCRYVHWELEEPALPLSVSPPLAEDKTAGKVREVEAPPLPLSVSLPLEEEKAAGEEREEMRAEWLNVDLRSFDVSVLGKFDVVLADPPWAIHQDLPCTSFPLSAHGAADIYFMKSTDG
jgi:mRNA (2'-O-methyladenosine-N6-)-methyltransferase